MGFLNRLLLILMTALIAVIVATVGIDRLAHQTLSRGGLAPFPRVVHAAGIITLLRDADALRRQDILVAANSDVVRVSITDHVPPQRADEIKAPYLAARLRDTIGGQMDGLEAYTDTRMAHPLERAGVEGSLTKAVAPIGGGRILLIEWLDPPKIASLTLLGLPPSLWAGVLGFGVAALALFATIREVQPLQRLTEAVSRFDASRPADPLTEKGAPDIRRLIRAVRGMQERMTGALTERTFMIGAISHDLRTYLTRLRLRTENIQEPELRERMAGDLDAMTQLIDTSLAFARGTTSSQTRIALDLSDLVAVEVEERNALGSPLALTATYIGDAIVMGDPVALRRVVCNILDNALKFARGTVTVSVEHTATQACIAVEDDGPGVPQAERGDVFDPFHQGRAITQPCHRRHRPRSRHRPPDRRGAWRHDRTRHRAPGWGPLHDQAAAPGAAARITIVTKRHIDPRFDKPAQRWRPTLILQAVAPTVSSQEESRCGSRSSVSS